MLNIKTRQKYLKNLGFYNGQIDGVEGSKTRGAYRKLQKKYFPEKYIDGIYGIQTEILLKNAERVKLYCKHFVLEEFKCECEGKYCTGYPELISISLLKYLERIRIKYLLPMHITSGLRCVKYNDSLFGSVKHSKHTKGKAIDFYTSRTDNLSYRKKVMDYFIKLPYANYTYCHKYTRGKLKKGYVLASYMGTSIHIDVV